MTESREKKKIAFIGLGNMGEALIRGIIKAGLYAPADIIGFDHDRQKCLRMKENPGIEIAQDNCRAVRAAETVVLAVKPQNLSPLLTETAGVLRSDHLLVSILAGVTTRRLEEQVPIRLAVVRVMPNTPSLVNRGMAAISAGQHASRRI